MEKKKFSLLGGTVLFGYLGCQSPDGVPGAPVGVGKPDTVATKDTIRLVGPPLAEPLTGPLVVRTGPTPGEPCVFPHMGACTKEGVLLLCLEGTLKESTYFQPDRYCVAGDTLVKYRHFGFTGLDRAGSRISQVPDRMLRDLRA